MLHPTERFTKRVSDYVKYRPGYPQTAIDHLIARCNLSHESVVADIGSGTGIFTKMLLDGGITVYAVEPNDAMRHAAEVLLQDEPRFISVAGSAEDTKLDDDQVDLIVSATAFHWFDLMKCQSEFKRILRMPGKVALLWNIRRHDLDDFSIAFGKIWREHESGERNVVDEDALKRFFAKGEFETVVYPNHQYLDLDGLIGRSFSSSLSPLPESNEGTKFRTGLTELFHRYEHNGAVRLTYDTKMYVGAV